MFDNIGKKIKMLAKIITLTGIILSFFIGIVLAFALDTLEFEAWMVIGVGALTIVIGVLLFWIGSFFMYGYGEIIDKLGKLESIADNMKALGKSMDNSNEKNVQNDQQV